MKTFYQIQITRDFDGTITERKIIGCSSQPVARRGFEVQFVYADERDIETAMVDLDENDQMIIVDDPDKIAAKESEAEIAMRIERIKFGQRLVAIMSIRNDAKNLTTQQIVQLVTDFADINQCWLNGSIATSRALVAALTPDGTILTTADKNAILAEIDANLNTLGY